MNFLFGEDEYAFGSGDRKMSDFCLGVDVLGRQVDT